MFLEGGPSEARSDDKRGSELARSALCAAGFFVLGKESDSMANHLTPEELSKELGVDRQEVIRVCVEEGVPIYHGKIDRYLYLMTQQHLAQQQPAA